VANSNPTRRFAGDHGSMLMLMPAAVLIMVVLAAITGDLTHVHIAQRDLIGVANSVANDAVTYGLDENEMRNPNSPAGDYPITPGRVQIAITASLDRHESSARDYRLDAAAGNGGFTIGVAPDGSPMVTVHLIGTVEHVFAPALDGSTPATIRATASARAARN
jgi:hypothetical protein